MGRSESKKAAAQSSEQSAQDQQNAQGALAATNKNLNDYSSGLNKFMTFGRQTYGQNGEFMKDQNAIATQAAGAGSNAVKGDLALNAVRTGENTAGYAPAVAEDRRARQRDLTGQLAGADATRLQNLTNINQFGVQASALPAQVQAGLYGTGTSGAVGQGSNQASAAKTPGFWDSFLPAVVGAAGTVAKGFTPHG
jgi:hypothetical protein